MKHKATPEPTAPTPPYFQRPQLTKAVGTALREGLSKGVTLFAPRRQGKTVFVINDLVPAFRKQGWAVGYVNLWMRKSAPARAMVEGLEAAVRGEHTWKTPGIRLSKVSGKLGVPGVAELGAEVQVGAGGNGDYVDRLTTALGHLEAKGPTLLVFDEFQALANAKDPDFVPALRTLLEGSRNIRVLFTGSSRKALNQMFRARHAPLLRSATAFVLPNLERDFCEDRARWVGARGVATDVDALWTLFQRQALTPQFFNDVVQQLVLARGDLVAAEAAWWKDLVDNDLGDALDGMSALHVAVLRVIASEGSPPIYSVDGLAKIGELVNQKVTAARVQTALKTLVARELVAPTGAKGGYDVDDKALLVWLRQNGDGTW